MKLREKHLRDQLRVKGLPYGHTRSRLEQHLRDKIRYREYLEQQLKNYEQTISTTPSPAPSPLAVPVVTTASQPIQPDEPFYSPMIHKMDEIFNNIGFNDEPCRKRLICSMYKTPENFSPYSNYISNELSKYEQFFKVQKKFWDLFNSCLILGTWTSWKYQFTMTMNMCCSFSNICKQPAMVKTTKIVWPCTHTVQWKLNKKLVSWLLR